MPTSLKKFDGQVYRQVNFYLTKGKANEEADRHRKKGRKARVILQAGLWRVYVRDK